jgi:GNAT superfamily N-acetyltransferase
MQLHYESANKDDFEFLKRIQINYVLRNEDPTVVDLNQILQRIEMNLKSNIESYYKVFLDNDIVGYYRMVENYDFSYDLSFLYVLKEYRNKGVGKEIIEFLRQEVDDPIQVNIFMKDSKLYDFLESQDFYIKRIISKSRILLQCD